jgi:single-strand DNA-binding protein
MQGDKEFKVTGNLADDPTLAYTQTGRSYCHLTVMTNGRYFDRDTSEWKAGKTCGWRITCWGDLADNVCSSLSKGAQVTVTGTEVERKYQDSEGKDRWTTEMTAEDVLASLRRSRVQIKKLERASAGNVASKEEDPWATR